MREEQTIINKAISQNCAELGEIKRAMLLIFHWTSWYFCMGYESPLNLYWWNPVKLCSLSQWICAIKGVVKDLTKSWTDVYEIKLLFLILSYPCSLSKSFLACLSWRRIWNSWKGWSMSQVYGSGRRWLCRYLLERNARKNLQVIWWAGCIWDAE